MIQTANDIFVLHTAHTTYAFRKLPTGQLEHLYYGRKIHVCEPLDENAVAPLIEKHTFQPGNSCVYDREHDAYTLEDVSGNVLLWKGRYQGAICGTYL